MPLITIVEDYLHVVLPTALYSQQEDGSVAAYIPGFPGVLGFGRDIHECHNDLSRALQEWIKTALAKGYWLPMVGGIDLNTEANQILTTYHDGFDEPVAREPMYANEDELEQAFAERLLRT